MSSEKLEDCEENLREVLEELKSYSPGWQKRDDSRRAFRRKLADGEALLRELETEVMRAPLYYQTQLSGRVRGYESDLAALRKDVEALSAVGFREDVFQQSRDDPYEDGERVQLLKNTDTLNRASASLHRAQKISAQTDRMGANIIDELGEQRSSLVRTRNKLVHIDMETRRSSKLLSTLACKALQNRIILVTVIIVELLILFGVLFYKLYKRFHQQ